MNKDLVCEQFEQFSHKEVDTVQRNVYAMHVKHNLHLRITPQTQRRPHIAVAVPHTRQPRIANNITTQHSVSLRTEQDQKISVVSKVQRHGTALHCRATTYTYAS